MRDKYNIKKALELMNRFLYFIGSPEQYPLELKDCGNIKNGDKEIAREYGEGWEEFVLRAVKGVLDV